MSEDQQQRSGSKSFTTTEVNLYDEHHSAISISSMCSFYKSDILLEFRPRDESSDKPKYISDKSNPKFAININETPALIYNLEAFINGDIEEFTIEHHGANAKRNLVFTQGNAFYDDENPEMAELCENALAVSIEDVTSDDEDEHSEVVFIDYGTELASGETIHSDMLLFKSAVEQLFNSFMRFDYTSTRLTLSNNKGGSGGDAPKRAANQPSRRRKSLSKGSSSSRRSVGGVGESSGDSAEQVEGTEENLAGMFGDE